MGVGTVAEGDSSSEVRKVGAVDESLEVDGKVGKGKGEWDSSPL